MKDYAFEIEMKVRDYECDLQGVVNNSNYKLPENILCAKGRIEAICLQNGKLTRGELFETIFINKVEKK